MTIQVYPMFTHDYKCMILQTVLAVVVSVVRNIFFAPAPYYMNYLWTIFLVICFFISLPFVSVIGWSFVELYKKLTGNNNNLRPFYENKTQDDFKEWFRLAPIWCKLDEMILDILIKRMYGKQEFELFMFTFMETGLLKQNYKQLNEIAMNIDKQVAEIRVCALIQALLNNLGLDSHSKCIERNMINNNEEFKKYYQLTFDAFESLICFEPKALPPYIYLAKMKMVSKDYEKAKLFCKAGLDQIKEIEKLPIPEQMRSSIEKAHVDLQALWFEICYYEEQLKL